MTRKLSSDLKTFREAYLEHYRGVREVLERRLPGLGWYPPPRERNRGRMQVWERLNHGKVFFGNGLGR